MNEKQGLLLLEKKHVIGYQEGLYKKVAGEATEIKGLTVFVDKKLPIAVLSRADRVPKILHGLPTDVVLIGEVVIQVDRKKRHRPIFGGISCGHPFITAGTLGDIADTESEEKVICSNAHVICPHWDGANIGDLVWQPGKHDGGSGTDVMGIVEDYEKIHFQGENGSGWCPFVKVSVATFNFFLSILGRKTRVYQKQDIFNVMDMAIGSIYSGVEYRQEIYGNNQFIVISGWRQPQIGNTMYKGGRTTEWSNATIQADDAVITVNYGGGKMALFEHQIITGCMSAGGDSGSTGLTKEGGLWLFSGRLFAGSDQSTIFNPPQQIIERFNLVY